MAAVTLLALTFPLADTLLAVRLVKLPLGLVIDVTALIVLALTYPEADMLLDVRLVKLPLGLVTDVAAATVLALTFPEADTLLAVMFVVFIPVSPSSIILCVVPELVYNVNNPAPRKLVPIPALLNPLVGSSAVIVNELF